MKVEEIGAGELEKLLASERELRLVNVLSRESFERIHIPGSESIPRRELAERASSELGREETIVVYCADESCQASPKAAAALLAMGYERVYDFAGGLAEWCRGGRPAMPAAASEAGSER
jgi:rhodanese-related sulfurtransferase